MQAGEVLRRLGGVATTAQILSHLDRATLEEAVAAGTVARATRGRYHLPEVGRHRQMAAAQGATLSHLSAAQQHGWPVLHPPDAAWLTVPRNRRTDRTTQAVVHAVWADLAVEERSAGLTSSLRTVLDCARRLPPPRRWRWLTPPCVSEP